MSSEKLSFRISTGLKNIIGRELITDDYVAILELVKNAYDAYASEVEIVFEKSKITIRDNGRGMDLNDLKEKWLFVAYSAKKDGSEYKARDTPEKQKSYRDTIRINKGHRHFAGAKGIGRFSSDRLGNRLTLKTKKDQLNAAWECIEVDWRAFEENPKDNFAEVMVTHSTLNHPIPTKFTHGTELIISDLSSKWDRKKKLGLKRSLEKLLNPHEGSDGFEITLTSKDDLPLDQDEANHSTKINGPVHNFVFEKLGLKTTSIKVTLNVEHIMVTLNDRGKTVYTFREKNDFKLIESAKASLFFLNRAAKVNFSRHMGMRSVEFGSVFVFRNGIRVYPYGSQGSDLFNLDRRKQQGYSRYLGSREVIGRLDFTDSKSMFLEQSSRDGGLIKSDGVDELIRFFRQKCLARLEKYVVSASWSLKDIDHFEETTKNIEASASSRQEIAKIIFNLAASRSIEILSVGKNFLELIKTKTEEIRPEYFKHLEAIAKATGDTDFLEHINKGEEDFKKLILEKQQAEEKQKRLEEKARAEEKARKEAEKRELQLQQEKDYAEIERLRAELRKRKAEEKARELTHEKEIAEKKRSEAEAQALALTVENKEKEQRILFFKAERGLDAEDAKNFTHAIIIAATNINVAIQNVNEEIQELGKASAHTDLKELMSDISRETQKILSLSKYVTKANFRADTNKITEDFILFLRQYSDIISSAFTRSPKVEFTAEKNISFTTMFRPLDISILLDNLINNSRKVNAKTFKISASLTESNQLQVSFSDDGSGLDNSITKPDSIFEKGFTTTNGSGLGLFYVKEAAKEIGGDIEINTEFTNGFELIMRLEHGNQLQDTMV